MATAEQVMDVFVAPLARILGEPNWQGQEPREVYASLAEDLAPFSVEALVGAVKIVRQKAKRFPTIPECLKACNEAPVERAPRPMTGEASWALRPAEALALMRDNIGACRQALADGCLCGLDRFVREHGRIPTGADYRALVPPVTVRERMTRLGRGAIPRSLYRLGEQMLEREAHLARMLGIGTEDTRPWEGQRAEERESVTWADVLAMGSERPKIVSRADAARRKKREAEQEDGA